MSVGQRQLLCLARAILRKNQILVMDEATASVDLHTDALIQQTLENEIIKRGCTLLAIAHRILTVIKMDRVLLMDDGKAEEFGPTGELLAKKDGAFRELAIAAGIAVPTI